MSRLPEQAAVKCFHENRELFSNAHTMPEKFNLYNGLANMAESIAGLRAEIKQLRQEVMTLRVELHHMRGRTSK